MHEDYDTRLWADHARDFSLAMSDLAAKTMAVFERLAAFNFAAPWQKVVPTRSSKTCTTC